MLVDLAPRAQRLKTSRWAISTYLAGRCDGGPRAPAHASSPPFIVNLAGPESSVCVRRAELARLLASRCRSWGGGEGCASQQRCSGLGTSWGAARRCLTPARVDGGLDSAWRREPGQAHALRIAERTLLIGVAVSMRSLTFERIRACDNVRLSRTAVCAGDPYRCPNIGFLVATF